MNGNALSVRDHVAKTLGVEPSDLVAERRRGAHGTRLLADARAATCWALAKSCPWLSHREIGDVVGLSTASVRQAIERAPKRFSQEELESFKETLR